MAVTTGQDQDPGPEPGTGSAQRGGSGVPGGRRKQRVSMADVAQRAGVSSQTVSRVSNGHPGVIDSTREQVLKAMRELGYRPNSAARALRYGQFNTIGVILFGLSSTGNSRTVEAIATHAAAEGYAITLTPIDVPTQDNVLGAFTRMGELAVDAVIVIIEVHLLDAGDRHAAARCARRGRRLRRRMTATAWSTPTRPTGRGGPCTTCSAWGTGPSGT